MLSTYQVSTETCRRKVFDQTFDQNNADDWLRTYRQSYSQWLDSMDNTTFEQVAQMAGDLHEEPQP